jgi:hypothetical protein
MYGIPCLCAKEGCFDWLNQNIRVKPQTSPLSFSSLVSHMTED